MSDKPKTLDEILNEDPGDLSEGSEVATPRKYNKLTEEQKEDKAYKKIALTDEEEATGQVKVRGVSDKVDAHDLAKKLLIKELLTLAKIPPGQTTEKDRQWILQAFAYTKKEDEKVKTNKYEKQLEGYSKDELQNMIDNIKKAKEQGIKRIN